jgi:hypothetical protein
MGEGGGSREENRMKKFVIAVAATCAALHAFACGSEADPRANVESGKKAEVGSLSLALIGADDQGTQYRLRNATFQISNYDYYPYPYPYPVGVGGASAGDGGVGNPSVRTVSSETNPDDPTIVVPLTPGTYTVVLTNDDWYLEKLTPSGAEVIPQSVLLSDRYQYAYISDRTVYDVTYTFGAGGTLIDFRRGDLHIGINVERPSVCGNGTIEGTEQCDGQNLNGQTCESLTWGSQTGVLGCNTACGFDYSGCVYGGGAGGGFGTGGAPGFDGGFPSGGAPGAGGAVIDGSGGSTASGGGVGVGGFDAAGGSTALGGGSSAGGKKGKP